MSDRIPITLLRHYAERVDAPDGGILRALLDVLEAAADAVYEPVTDEALIALLNALDRFDLDA